MRFVGKVVVVTGGSSGFGRATAVRFAEEGARVLVADLDGDSGADVISAIRQAGGTADLHVADIATAQGAASAIAAAAERFGGIDVLVNNAGIAPPEGNDSWDAEEDSWDRVVRINLKSIYLCSRAAIPIMLGKGGGAIVNVASIAATSKISCASYAAAKSGILGYTLQVAAELASRNVRVNSVSPGIMRTPMSTGERRGMTPAEQEENLASMGRLVPMQRVGRAEDIAAAVAFLASADAQYITGQELIVDGGYVVR